MKVIVTICLALFILSCKHNEGEKPLSTLDKAKLYAATLDDSCTAKYVSGSGTKKGILFTTKTSSISQYWLNVVTDYCYTVVRNCVIKDSVNQFDSVHFHYIIPGLDTIRRDFSIAKDSVKLFKTIEDKTNFFFVSISKWEKAYFSKDETSGKINVTCSIRQDYDDNKMFVRNCARFLKFCVLSDSAKFFANMGFYYSRRGQNISYPLNDTLFKNP